MEVMRGEKGGETKKKHGNCFHEIISEQHVLSLANTGLQS